MNAFPDLDGYFEVLKHKQKYDIEGDYNLNMYDSTGGYYTLRTATGGAYFEYEHLRTKTSFLFILSNRNIVKSYIKTTKYCTLEVSSKNYDVIYISDREYFLDCDEDVLFQYRMMLSGDEYKLYETFRNSTKYQSNIVIMYEQIEEIDFSIFDTMIMQYWSYNERHK